MIFNCINVKSQLKVIFLSFLTLSITGCSYTKNLSVLSRKQAVYDLDYLVENVKAIHPEPFTHISEEGFGAHAEQIKANLGDKTSRKDFSLSIAELLALIGDDHTGCNITLDCWDFIRSGGKLFPLGLYYNDGAMKVGAWAKTIEPEQLKKGDTVIAINGKPMESLLEQYRKYISAETMEQKNWMAGPLLPTLLWHTEGELEFFDLTMKNLKEETYHERVEACHQENYKTVKDTEFPFTFHYDNQVCLLKAPSFWPTLREKWIKTLDELFPQMAEKGTSVLIVDLRKNGGGDGGLGLELIRRIAQEPYKTHSKRMRYSKAYQKALLIYGLRERSIPAFLHLENILKLNDFHPYPIDLSKLEGEYITYGHAVTHPYKDNWNGSLVLITSHYTSSAAVDMAAIVKDNQLGIIVGDETGGRASFFSDVAMLFLPNSGLGSMIATSRTVRPGGYDDGHGVLPDLQMDVTLEDSILVEKIFDYLN